MGETYWPQSPETLTLPMGTTYAQTFIPLWSHTLDEIRLRLQLGGAVATVKLSIQYLHIDGEPDGIDLVSYIFDLEYDPWFTGTYTRKRKFPALRLVAGIGYALLIHTTYCLPAFKPSTWYTPPPSAYPRGKLIKSIDGGTTWHMTDLGDLSFSEYGYPPLAINPWTTPLINVAITEISQNDYRSNACIRVATTQPCTLRLHITKRKPSPVETYRPTRGTAVLCLDHYVFIAGDFQDQKERWDSLYHTFYIGGLTAGEDYWITFTSTIDFIPSVSRSPIFKRTHPPSPPFTTTLRPHAPGDECRIDWQVGEPCPFHYKNVNEATPDENTTYVATRYTDLYRPDLYRIPNLTIDHASLPIDQLHITARLRRQGGYAYVHLAKIGFKVNGLEWWTDPINGIPLAYKNFHLHLYTNPITELPWTYSEINDLQVGIRLRHYSGVGWGAFCCCTQLYCKIYHQCEAYQ